MIRCFKVDDQGRRRPAGAKYKPCELRKLVCCLVRSGAVKKVPCVHVGESFTLPRRNQEDATFPPLLQRFGQVPQF
jgi:hypothetical protein